jgi:hypothetical protein
MVSLPRPCVFRFLFTLRRGRLTGIGTRFGGARRPVGHFKSPNCPARAAPRSTLFRPGTFAHNEKFASRNQNENFEQQEIGPLVRPFV